MEDQPHQKWAFQIHGQAADKIFQESLTHIVRNDHYREERNQRSEHHAVDKDDQPGFFKIGKFGAFNFAIDLRERFFSAHGQNRVAQRDEDRNNAKYLRQ